MAKKTYIVSVTVDGPEDGDLSMAIVGAFDLWNQYGGESTLYWNWDQETN